MSTSKIPGIPTITMFQDTALLKVIKRIPLVAVQLSQCLCLPAFCGKLNLFLAYLTSILGVNGSVFKLPAFEKLEPYFRDYTCIWLAAPWSVRVEALYARECGPLSPTTKNVCSGFSGELVLGLCVPIVAVIEG